VTSMSARRNVGYLIYMYQDEIFRVFSKILDVDSSIFDYICQEGR